MRYVVVVLDILFFSGFCLPLICAFNVFKTDFIAICQLPSGILVIF